MEQDIAKGILMIFIWINGILVGYSMKKQSKANTTENTDEIQSKPTSIVILFDNDGYARRYEIGE